MAVETKGKTTKQLREEADALLLKAQAYNTEHEDKWDDEREAAFSAMIDDRSTLIAAATRRQRLADMGSGSSPNIDPADPGDKPGDGNGGTAKRQTVLMRMGCGGDGRPRYVEESAADRGSAEYRQAFGRFLQTRRGSQVLHENAGQEGGFSRYAALQSDNAEQAGYLVASEQMAAGILKDVDDLLFIRQYAKIHTVREASSLGIKRRTARMSTFGWSSELAVSTADTSLKYGKKTLTPHHLTGAILLSRDLVRRSAGIAEAEVRGEMARDAGEVMEDAYLTGHGSQQPLGVFTASSDGISTGRDVSSGSTTSISADSLLEAKYTLKSQYRRGQRGPLRWLFHRDGIKIIAKLKDGSGQYLFQTGMGQSVVSGMPEDTLLGIPVDESERAPNTFTTGLYVGLLANWNYYEIADALDLEIQVLVELNAATNQIQYIGRLKTDGMPTIEEAFVRLKTD